MLFGFTRRRCKAASRASYVLSYFDSADGYAAFICAKLPCKSQNVSLEADADTACFIIFGD